MWYQYRSKNNYVSRKPSYYCSPINYCGRDIDSYKGRYLCDLTGRKYYYDSTAMSSENRSYFSSLLAMNVAVPTTDGGRVVYPYLSSLQQRWLQVWGQLQNLSGSGGGLFWRLIDALEPKGRCLPKKTTPRARSGCTIIRQLDHWINTIIHILWDHRSRTPWLLKITTIEILGTLLRISYCDVR